MSISPEKIADRMARGHQATGTGIVCSGDAVNYFEGERPRRLMLCAASLRVR
ncbi:hypothetical protein [Variovorax boronicumulans]|uniref:hypothetical protein n=1 Tax=Variovorax boronicumulans TaxID=436515 RepID=UPI001C583433